LKFSTKFNSDYFRKIKVKKMFIFDYFRVFLVFNTKKMAIFGHPFGLYPISRQRIGITLRLELGFRWKALVTSFSKIYKSIYKNKFFKYFPLISNKAGLKSIKIGLA
jgi:hypothetical protein